MKNCFTISLFLLMAFISAVMIQSLISKFFISFFIFFSIIFTLSVGAILVNLIILMNEQNK